MKSNLQAYKIIAAYMCALSVVLCAPVVIPYGYEITCGLILIWMLRGAYQVLQGLSIIVIIKSLNPAFVEITYTMVILGWVAVLLAGIRCIFLLKPHMLKTVLSLTLFCCVVLILSYTNSPVPDVSMMKILSFFWFVLAMTIAALSLNEKEAEYFKYWVFSFYLLIIFISVPMYFIPEIGFKRNGLGFQGVVNHPQLFAILLVPFTAWFVSGLFLDKKKFPNIAWIVVIFLVVILFLTQARTSILALFLSVFGAFIASLISNKQIVNRSRAISYGVTLLVLISITIFMSTKISNQIEQFVYKDGNDESISTAFNASRGDNVKSQWNNFLASPLMGTGFGVYPSGKFPAPISYFRGIPISASVEKGFLPTMILEEIGIIGALFFLLFIYQMGKYVFNNKDIKWIAVFLSCLFINFGEAVFFAINGISQWFWLLIVLCIAQSSREWKQKKLKI